MRHRVYGKLLGRNKNERTRLFRSLVQSLFLSESIQTTSAKANAIKGIVDKLINQAKSPDTRRLVAQFLVDKRTQDKLIKDLAPRLKSRTSGYTSIVKIGKRLGDGAMIVQLKLLVEGAPKPEKVASGKKQEASKSVKTEEQKTGKLEAESKKQKTGNKKGAKKTKS